MKRVIILMVLSFTLSFVYGQPSLPKKCKVLLPDYIESPKGNPKGIREGQSWQNWCESRIERNDFGKKKGKGPIWVAYSDRNANATYSSPNSSQIYKSLDFGEKVFIADIADGYALIFKNPNLQTSIEIGSDAICLGWIPIRKLLLWEECPKSQNQIYQKGLVVHDPSKSKAVEKSPNYLLSPDANATKSSRRATELEILFVLKKEIIGQTTYYLMSQDLSINGKAHRVLLGWLSDDYITEWDQRLCMEPTHYFQAVQYYRSKTVFPCVFNDEGKALNFYRTGNVENAFWQYPEFSEKRMDASKTRHPILSKKAGSEIYRTATIASMGAESNVDYEKIKNRIQQLEELADNINVIFVIDATSSMKRYYPSVVNAIQDIMKRDFFSKVKVGCVLYKDYKDPDCIGYKSVRGQSDMAEVANFISNYQIGSVDPDDYEALFMGLETALDTKKMGYSKDHSNFIILVGDAGNHRKDDRGDDWNAVCKRIAGKMAEYNINFLAYQINNAGGAAYNDFPMQVGSMQRSLVDNYQSIMKLKGKVGFELKSNKFYELTRTQQSDEELPIYVSFKYAKSGNSESPEGLRHIIVNNVTDFQNKVSSNIEILRGQGLNMGMGQIKAQPLREILRLKGWNESQIESYISYLRSNGATKIVGCMAQRTQSAPYNLFDYVLFFSANELTNIIHELDKINSAANLDKREAFQDALISMGQAMLGQMNADDIRRMDITTLMSQIYGVPVEMKTCGFTIEEIIDMPIEVLQPYIDLFRSKLEGLKRIQGSSYNGRFTKNDKTYYWIPFSDIPGYCL